MLNVRKGKSLVLYCKAQTIAPNVGKLFVRNNVVPLRPVPIGYGADYRDFFNSFVAQTEPATDSEKLQLGVIGGNASLSYTYNQISKRKPLVDVERKLCFAFQ